MQKIKDSFRNGHYGRNADRFAYNAEFSNFNGLKSTLYQTKKAMLSEAMVKKVQIIHCKKRQHWFVATTVNNRSNGEVKVFDSIFVSIDKETKQVLLNHDKAEPKLKYLKSQKQSGSKIADCLL